MAPSQYPCDQCGSTDFEEIDAILYCHRGHVQEGGQQIGEDDGNFARIGKKTRQKETKEKQKAVKVYRGPKGYRLFLKAWQHILWRQCYTLIHTYGLPRELWALVRELWALRLSKLTARLGDSVELELSETSQSSDGPDSELESEYPEDRNLKAGKLASDNPNLADTISLNYLGILLLRHPTSLATIYKYIRREELCYIRAIRFVPKDIRDHLAPEYHLSLDTISIPTQSDLQLAVYRSAVMFGSSFEIALPPINWTLMLLNHIRTLALPIEIFPAVQSLAKTVNYQFSYPRALGQRRTATSNPEAQLMSLIVIATKLCFPLDSGEVNCSVKSSTEPAALEMNWTAWLDARAGCDGQDNTSSKRLTSEKAIEVTDEHILAMPEEQLDQYMDWFQQTYTHGVKGNNLHKQILDMFPLQQVEHTVGTAENDRQRGSLERIHATQAGLQSRPVQELGNLSVADSGAHPGQAYQAYRSTKEMSEVVMAFHQDAAELACLDVDALIRACLRTERMLLRNEHEMHRSELFSEEMNEK